MNQAQFENYLREFEPKRPRALPESTVERANWRRLVAAAAIVFVCGSCLWFGLKEKQAGRNPVSASEWKKRIALTNQVLENPESLAVALEEQAKGSLPPLDGQESTLGVLAKE